MMPVFASNATGVLVQKLQHAGFNRNATDGKIVIAGKKHLRIGLVGIQADEIADV